HAIDDLADDPSLNAGQAAKIVTLVARPLGLAPGTFDPDHDGARNLRTVIDASAKPDGSYGTFNATLYVAIAKRILGDGVPPATLALIRSAQGPDGGWNFAGDASSGPSDVDTTALALQALAAARVTPTDWTLLAGLVFLANSNEPSGAWQSF